MNKLERLERMKTFFRETINNRGGLIGIWTPDEYIDHWAASLSVSGLTSRLRREARIFKQTYSSGSELF
jgi:hypothetical protein